MSTNPQADYFSSAAAVIAQLKDDKQMNRALEILAHTKKVGGRLFLIGCGGGAGHASHATCDFRKLAGIEAYCPTDNVSELTARINDDGWENSLSAYLEGSKIDPDDTLLVLSVGGGSVEHGISVNLIQAIRSARLHGAAVISLVGKKDGFAAQHSDACILLAPVESHYLTPITESMQALVWHYLVSHPKLQQSPAKWESALADSAKA